MENPLIYNNNIWYHGEDIPLDKIGNNGDFYIRANTYIYYKYNDIWVFGGTIRLKEINNG